VLEFTVPDRSRISDAVTAVAPIGESEPHADKETGVVSVGVGGRGSDALIEAVRGLDAVAVRTQGLALRRPSLDDVFLALTGHAVEEDEEGAGSDRRRGRGRGRRAARRDGSPDGGKGGSQHSGQDDAGTATTRVAS
jgi:hypothetical protein